MDREIKAAEDSLVETKERMWIEIHDLEMALDLVDDIRTVYLASDDKTRAGYNQAFFKKLLVRVESSEITDGHW